MKCYIAPPPMTEKEQADAEKKAIKTNNKYLQFADHLLCLSLRNNAGFGYKRFAKYNEESLALGRHYVEYYGMEDEEPEEYAVSSYYALARHLRDYGWEAEENLWKDNIFDTFKPHKNSRAIRDQHKTRVEYAKGISFYVREMLCMAALWMREECGWAEVRLNRVLRPVVEEYLAVMREFLKCSAEGDNAMNQRIRKALKDFNAMKIFKEEY